MTPMTPLMTEIAIIAATSSVRSLRSTVTCPPGAGWNALEMTSRSRNAGITPSADAIRIRKVTTESLRQ